MIQLTEPETRICNLLLETTSYISWKYPTLKPITLRIAGGWVRDKLLGLESNDLDIAIDSIKGECFANYVKEYMATQGETMGTIATILVNPEKSKHLETATAKILDHDLDFVHLRTELYLENSRMPQVEFGTPLEDALRRDITINALFYNLTSKQIEDFTGLGLIDLKDRVVRTPLPPLQTFLDDPLRVLRVVRFATRFDYTIHPETLACMALPQIHEAIELKVSKERIGVELDKMAQGHDPVRSCQIIYETGLYPTVFSPPLGLQVEMDNPWLPCSVLFNIKDTIQWISLSKDDLRYLVLATWTSQFRELTYTEKAKVIPVSRHVIVNSIKLGNAESDHVVAFHSKASMIQRAVLENQKAPLDRVRLGLLLRDLAARPLESKWSCAVLFACVMDVSSSPQDMDSILSSYQLFMDRVDELNLQDPHLMVPLINGKDIANLLKMKPGPRIGVLLNKVIEWQLQNPFGSVHECVEFLQNK